MGELIESFCELPVRRALYEYVATRTPVTLVSKDSGTWGSQTVEGETTIFISPSNHPHACLAHELLHAKLKVDGYRQYLTAICRTSKKDTIDRLLAAIDNELQHHRFFGDFIAMGFDPAEMYHDTDNQTSSYIRAELPKLQGAVSPPESYFYLLISIIAPGGRIENEERKELLELLEDRAPRRYWKKLTHIEEFLKSFAESVTLDAGESIVQILESLGGYEPTWIAPDMDFPQSGRFVGRSFTVQDIGSNAV